MGVETGNHYENVPVMPGHHEDLATPIACLCCGKDYYWVEGPKCFCRHVVNWYQDEKMRVTCQLHMAEKVKDGLFAC